MASGQQIKCFCKATKTSGEVLGLCYVPLSTNRPPLSHDVLYITPFPVRPRSYLLKQQHLDDYICICNARWSAGELTREEGIEKVHCGVVCLAKTKRKNQCKQRAHMRQHNQQHDYANTQQYSHLTAAVLARSQSRYVRLLTRWDGDGRNDLAPIQVWSERQRNSIIAYLVYFTFTYIRNYTSNRLKRLMRLAEASIWIVFVAGEMINICERERETLLLAFTLAEFPLNIICKHVKGIIASVAQVFKRLTDRSVILSTVTLVRTCSAQEHVA